MTGSTLGHYRVGRLLGKGGMGEVYAAEDLQLGRQVALKVLPISRARSEDRQRFAQEARVVASLNHPRIVTLHSFEHERDVDFLTMELVEGTPLSQRIPRSGMAVDALLPVSLEIAEALVAAHEKGVVHRDLKPANVLLTSDGHVKVLDFGLAKLRDANVALNGELPTRELTGEGRIVGTVAYMSPEQAEGRSVDHRTDIFSFGVMLYELATGARPFQGDTSLSVLSALLKETPRSVSDVNPAVPGALARLIRMCLQKDPERRFQSAKDLRNELHALKEELDSGELARVAPGALPTAPPRRLLWLVAALAVVAAAAAIAYLLWNRRTDDPIALNHVQLTTTEGREFTPSISHDGRWFVYASSEPGSVDNFDIYLRSVGGQTTLNLTRDSPVSDDEPAFSPDGEHIAFRSERGGGGLFVMSRTGEKQRALSTSPTGYSPAWSHDGTRIAFASRRVANPASRAGWSELWVLDVASGRTTRILEADGMNPAWSPNDRFIAFWSLASHMGPGMTAGARNLWVMPSEGGAPWQLTDDLAIDRSPQWSSDGRFLYFASDRGGSMNLWRLPMDPDTGRRTGEPEAVTLPSSYVAHLSMSAGGRFLAYTSRTSMRNIYRASFDSQRAALGNFVRITNDTRAWNHVAVSRDGTRLAMTTTDPQEDLYVSLADGSKLNQLTNDAHFDRGPHWHPNGELISFFSNRSGAGTGRYEIYTSNLSGQLNRLTAAGRTFTSQHWSPTGDRMQVSDLMTRETLIFDPGKSWNDQTPDVLPLPPGSDRALFETIRWSPEGTKLAGRIEGRVVIYDIATRRYEDIAGGSPGDWLPDGRLFVGRLDGGLDVYDLATRTAQPVTINIPPDLPPGGPVSSSLTRDGKTMYLIFQRIEEDIRMVELGTRR
jgi:serine/threonine protein kinase